MEAEEIPLWVDLSSFLEDLSNDGGGRIGRIRDDENKFLRNPCCNTKSQIMTIPT
jgi:hypothetical protein